MVGNTKQPDWVIRGKTIRELIIDLKSFENQDLEVRLSIDDGETSKPISLVKKRGMVCLIVNCEGK